MRRTVSAIGYLTPFAFALTSLACERPAGFRAGPVVMFRENPAHTGVSLAPFFEGQGGIHWRVQTDGGVHSTPAVTATRVFAGSGDHKLYAIDRAAGTVVWTFDAGDPVYGSPAVAGGLVVTETIGGRIFAVGESDGHLRWSLHTRTALPLNTHPAGDWDMLASSATIVDSTIYIGGPDGKVYALDLMTGHERWTAATKGRVRAAPSVVDGAVVTGSFDGRVYAFDMGTGKERWVHRTIGDTLDSSKFGYDRRAVQGSAAIADGMAFVGSRDGGVYGLDARTGERRWYVSHHGSWVYSSPAVSQGRVYVGSSDGHFFQALEATTGRELWRLPTNANVNTSPLLVGGTLLVGTWSTDATFGDLLAVDPANGALRWRLRLDGAIQSSPAAADSEIYIGTEGGSIYAIHEVSHNIPRLAVFYDSSLAGQATVPGGGLAYNYFRDQGYDVLNGATVGPFFAERIRDCMPSVIVFAIDVMPDAVGPTAGNPGLLRRYLESGGKIVWTGAPIGSSVRNDKGELLGEDPRRTEPIIGVPSADVDYNEYIGFPTGAGRRWGIARWFRGDYTYNPTVVTEAFTLDEQGQTTAWVKNYRKDRPGAGFVQLWGLGATADRLATIRDVAEYGILKRAVRR